jgi:hypothetical protein
MITRSLDHRTIEPTKVKLLTRFVLRNRSEIATAIWLVHVYLGQESIALFWRAQLLEVAPFRNAVGA